MTRYAARTPAARAAGRSHEHLPARTIPLAQFRDTDAPGKRGPTAVEPLRLFDTPFRSPQPWLFPLDDEQWRTAYRVAAYAARRRPRDPVATQLPLFPAPARAAASR
ncbi:MAG TPA: hypothetical protein VFL91_01075 [Thermomicrobiales bacterium]|nr:hypothetical protein [Thermomicrobiales bacterium]